jgi:glycine/D-amino acid oxidase-like deaminating enzyme/nitrite reductase/ring-hydroxylating ferredoxin subunit
MREMGGAYQGAPIAANYAVDCCVVGGGVTGLTIAYLLRREGLSVVLLEGGALGGGETERTSAHLSSALDDGFVFLERMHGARGAKLAAESHSAAIDRIELIAREEGINCAFQRVDGYLFNAPEKTVSVLTDELAAARRAGLADCEIVERLPLPGATRGPALRFGGQAQFHPMQYLNGLARAFEKHGGLLFTHSHVVNVSAGAPARVEVANGRVVTAKHVIVATNSPINDLFAIHTKQEAYRSYVIAAKIDKGSVASALFWDTAEPYHYARTYDDLLIVGGEDHKTGQATDFAERYSRLEWWIRDHFPNAGELVARWSGQVLEPVDGLAFIGRNPKHGDNIYIATGDSGHGLTHGTIAGMLIRDLILSRPNAWAALYDPSRKSLAAAAQFLKANLNVAGQYAGWLKAGEVQNSMEIPAGAGRLMRRGLQLLAVYRDEHGCTHERSAACTHLGGVVQWNDTEKSWDCPCHGARYDAFGSVISGPALDDLAAVSPTPNDPNVVVGTEVNGSSVPETTMTRLMLRIARR